jgi:glycosyltransferase involved in cell wall biosynthesis
MIEAMACGTPVVAFRSGSVPEVVDHGLTGFIVGSINEAVDAVHCTALLDRSAIRATFERRFSVERMARDYVELYDMLGRGDRSAALSDTVLPISA